MIAHNIRADKERQREVELRARFDGIWQQHSPRLRRLVARLAGDMDLADDLTQEVCVKAFQAFGSFRGDASALTWFSRIAINVVNRYREGHRHMTIPLDSAELSALSTLEAVGPEALALQSAMQPIIWAAIDRLPEELRTTLILQIYEGLKYREIATLLNIPLGTVKSRLHTALARLREELQAHV